MTKWFYGASMSALLCAPAFAQPASPPASLAAGIVTTVGTTNIPLPFGWHGVRIWAKGGAGGSGCGIVETAGTAATGGATGGTAILTPGEIQASVAGPQSTMTIVVGAAGLPCTASGTTAGSTGSTPGVGQPTTVTIGSFVITANVGGAGTNGITGAGTAGGGGAGFASNGGSASGSTAVSPGAIGGTAGGSGTAGVSAAFFGASAGGNGAANGSAGTGGASIIYGSGPGGSGGGFTATHAALNGGAGSRPGPFQPTSFATAGNLSCTGTSQNGATAVGTFTDPSGGSYLLGAGGAGGASCLAGQNGGNGGAAAGIGASGGAGGAAEPGNTAGSAGASTGGGVVYEVF